MWISKNEFEFLKARVLSLEERVKYLENEIVIYPDSSWSPYARPHPISLSQAFYVLINHLGIKFIHTSKCESWEIEKKDAF